MKISSVSKKVLASALSAAMVVAFAPTVAFGTTPTNGDTVTVTYKMDGGIHTAAGSQDIVETETLVANAGKWAFNSVAEQYSKNGYSLTGFAIDANGNGVKDDNEAKIAFADGIADDSYKGKSITLIAQYDAPSAAVAAGVYKKNDEPAAGLPAYVSAAAYSGLSEENKAKYSLKTEAEDPAAYIDDQAAGTGAMIVAIDGTAVKAGNIYKVALTKDGAAVAEANYTGATLGSSLTVTFGNQSAAELNADGVIAVKDKIAAGTYEFTVTDVTKGAALSIAKVQVIEVTADANGAVVTTATDTYAQTYTFKAVVGQGWKTALASSGATSLKPCKSSTATDTYTNQKGQAFQKWVCGDVTVSNNEAVGVARSEEAVVKADSTSIKADYATPEVKKMTYAHGTGLQVVTDDLATDDTHTYTVTYTAPDGSKLAEKSFAGDADEAVIAAAKVCSFGALTPALGEYTVTVTDKVDSEITTVGTAKCTIVKVAYSAGDGKFAKTTNTYCVDTYTYAGNKLAKGTIEGDNYTDELTAPDTMVFDGWSVDGAKIAYDKENNYTLGTGIGFVVTLTATYKVGAAAAPTATYADGRITLASAAGSDYQIKYSVNGEGYGSTYNAAGTGVTVDPKGTSYLAAKTVAKAGTLNALEPSAPTILYGYHNAQLNTDSDWFGDEADDTVSGYATAALDKATAASTATKPVYYKTVLTTVKADAEAAIKAVGYATEEGWKTAVLGQEKAILKAIADYEIAQIEAAKTPVKSADGKTYTYVSDAAAATAKTAVEAVLTAFDLNNDKDTTNNVKVKTSATTEVAGAGATAGNYADAIAYAAKSATVTTVNAADADAAAAVSAQLKAAATAADAKAALEAYAALSTTAKELVATADVAAAEAIVAAAEVKDAQDDAAVSKARSASKTVKAGKNGKTAKKQSLTLKKITSKSGAKVTYKKSSGSSKVTVKSGKAYLAKGVKKGTYKATVTAKCGTQTAKIKVTFKVK